MIAAAHIEMLPTRRFLRIKGFISHAPCLLGNFDMVWNGPKPYNAVSYRH